MRSDLSDVNWNENSTSDISDLWFNFSEKLIQCIDKHVPKTVPSNSRKKKLWINKEALQAIDEKNKAWKKYRACKTKHNYQLYAEKRNKSTHANRKAKSNFERLVAENIKTDSKSFWNYVRSKNKTRTGISDLYTSDGSLSNSDVQKAELLNNFFSSVFTDEDLSVIPDVGERAFNYPLESITITVEAVEKKLKQLKTDKSPGMDNIHPIILKECSSEICKPLTDLFNISLKKGTLPEVWKIG